MQELLKQIFQKYKIEASEKQIEQLVKFYELVISWNEKINLTAITDKKEFAFKHILDSVLPYACFSENAKLIDVGAGAGFPSIPLKILRPDLDITMLDSLNKRVNFLNLVIETLGLEKIRAIHGRCEDVAKDFMFREKFDYGVARAVAALPTLLEYVLPFVKVGGQMLAYKSVQAQSELALSTHAQNILGGRSVEIKKYMIYEISSERNIIVINKQNHTPAGYPRSGNKAKSNPL